MRPADAARVNRTSDLPAHLREAAARFLEKHGELLPEYYRGLDPASSEEGVDAQIESSLGLTLLAIAVYETVPPEEAAGNPRAVSEHFGMGTNIERRRALMKGQPYGDAFAMWRARGREDEGSEEPAKEVAQRPRTPPRQTAR